MIPASPSRLLLAVSLSGMACAAAAQSSALPGSVHPNPAPAGHATFQPKPSAAIPATAPTTLPPSSATFIPVTAPVQAAAPGHPAHTEVTYRDGQLEIDATNSSLNEILRQVSRRTGLRITGGVTEEPVYGRYGPGAPADVLATLLGGTGSNLLFVQSSGDTPPQLILTARQGGATPPNPNAAASDRYGEPPTEPVVRYLPPSMIAPPAAPIPISTDGTTINPASSNASNGLTPGQATPGSPNAPPVPNGIKTPQEIYEQLQRLRQQQQAPPR